MPSNDAIMTYGYYEGTSQIINESTEIGRLLGIVDANHLSKPKTELRRRNRIRTIQSSLSIEGNTLSEEQITAILENKIIAGPPQDIVEVKNAIEVYGDLKSFNGLEESSYLKAHATLMKGLVENAGSYRSKGVGIFKGDKVAHLAPPAWNVHNLMRELFNYLSKGKDNLIIKSCVFHYEMEFIHPFMDGNGRMGRLWQTILLMKHHPVFEFLPIETEIKNSQQEYYDVLAQSDKSGKATIFVEYMLGKISLSLRSLIDAQRSNYSDVDRIRYYSELNENRTFTRKEYMEVFKKISSATATRDLRKGVELGLIERIGENRNAVYQVKYSEN
jgi:Fic family protein